MKKILNKKALYILLIILFIIIIIAFSCVLNDIKKIASDPDFKTIWDVDLRVPVIDYATTPIDLGEYVEDKAINSLELPPLPGLTEWPVSPTVNINVTNSIAVDTFINFDGGVSDFTLTGYYSQHSNVFKILIWVTDAGNNNLSISNSYIGINSISIEGNVVTFNSPVNQDNVLTYTSTNFLDPADEYYLDLGGDGDLDFTVDIDLLDNPPVYTGGPYSVHVKLVFDLGDDFGVVGTITNPAVLKNILDQDIPIGDFPAEELDKFRLEFEYDSNLPFDLVINTTFYGSEQIPSPNTFNTTIASGILSTSPMYGYQYATGLNKSNDDFKFNDNVLDYGDMKIDLQLMFPGGPWTPIRLDTDTLIKVKIVASAEATISL